MFAAKLLSRVLLTVTLFGSLANCAENEAAPPNFLILIGDDMGVETLSCYGIGNQTARTPTLDDICDSGVRFDNFWSQPVCSPTRATILSGQFGFRNGVGTPATGPDIEYPVPEMPAGAPEETGGRGGVELTENDADDNGRRARGRRDGGRRNSTASAASRP
ncbi:MAG: sulfatase-like hydrolase/transferase, partial [Woeseiaceae bacterium]